MVDPFISSKRRLSRQTISKRQLMEVIEVDHVEETKKGRSLRWTSSERLNVGTVPTFKIHNVGTIPTFKMHNVGIVPAFKM